MGRKRRFYVKEVTCDTHRKFLIPYSWQLFVSFLYCYPFPCTHNSCSLYTDIPQASVLGFSPWSSLITDLTHSRTPASTSVLMIWSPYGQSWLHALAPDPHISWLTGIFTWVTPRHLNLTSKTVFTPSTHSILLPPNKPVSLIAYILVYCIPTQSFSKLEILHLPI